MRPGGPPIELWSLELVENSPHGFRVICRYIYLCKTQKNQPFIVGKYMRNTWIVWDFVLS